MKILFQGDSITDAGRSRENNDIFGMGYPLLVKAELGFEEPGKYEFLNKGISGNRVIDVYARIKLDIINLKPDVMSILIGVNDVWAELSQWHNGIDSDKYYTLYDMMIKEIKEALPDIKIMIMEPFVLKGPETTENWDAFNTEVKKRAQMAKKISEKYGLVYIELQAGFDELSKKTGTEYWLSDGVHPTSMGHEYIKNQWIKAFKTLNV